MPLFRRREAESEPLTFTVGVSDHRVIVGTAEAGCRLLDDIEQYQAFIDERQGLSGARDTVGVLNAKLDYADLVDTAVSVLVLAFEELVERGVVVADEVPGKPEASRLRRDLATYEYIQDAYARAQIRCAWIRRVDELLRPIGVAVCWPVT